MKKDDPVTLVKVNPQSVYQHYIEAVERYVPVDEKFLGQYIKGFPQLNESAREREFKKFLKDKASVVRVDMPPFLTNAHRKLRLEHRRDPKPVDFTIGARKFLQVAVLWEDPQAGFRFAADILCGMHCTAIRQVESGFHPVLAADISSPLSIDVFTTVIQAAIPRCRWKFKKCTVKREAVLDYRIPFGRLPHHIQDFTEVKFKIKGQKALRIPTDYQDTAVVVIGTNSAQMREAATYLENASVILINCAPGDFFPTKLSASSLASYDQSILNELSAERQRVAALLRWWWSRFDDEDVWAAHIVQEARASFGKPDSRYIHVELDPRKLRDAIRYRVLLSFINELEAARFLTAKELEPYRTGAREVFDPAPKEDKPPRRAEDPDVFLEIMRDLVQHASIVPEGERYVKSSKALGAWMPIGEELHLVMLEEIWAREYKKEAKKRKDLDTSFFQREHWERDMQKLLVEHEMIKPASSGYRYRYDLLKIGARDTTYVVAVPAGLLEN